MSKEKTNENKKHEDSVKNEPETSVKEPINNSV
jgi:hypothetical protein